MGLCRNGPPPDSLQYDNSSGTSSSTCLPSCFMLCEFSFPYFFFFFLHNLVIVSTSDHLMLLSFPRALSHLHFCSLPKFRGDRAKPGEGGLVLHRHRGSRAVFQVQCDGGGLAARGLPHGETPAALPVLHLHPEPPVHRQPALVLTLCLLAAPHRPCHTGKIHRNFNTGSVSVTPRTVQNLNMAIKHW